jgi:hypothetical protein
MLRSTEPALSPAARRTLVLLAKRLDLARDPWWLIGGAAAALHGVGSGDLADIDVIMSAADASTLLEALGVPPEPDGGSALFRSEVFGRWREPPTSVDIMGGFQVCADGLWRPVQPATRKAVVIGERTLYAPERRELIAMLRLFGRPKDIVRAEALGASA